MRAAMVDASQRLEFERAAIFRERLELFDWLAESLRNTQSARAGQSFVYRTMGAGGLHTWFAIHQGRVISIIKAPETTSERKRVHRAFEAIYGPERLGRTPVAPQEIDHLLLIAAWFRLHPAEQAHCAPPGEVLSELASSNAGHRTVAVR